MQKKGKAGWECLLTAGKIQVATTPKSCVSIEYLKEKIYFVHMPQETVWQW